MKWLAVDYGDSRTGLAGCDAGETITSPITPQIEEKSMNKVAAAVTAVAQARGAEALVCGLPKNMDGTEGSRANKSRRFAQRLANTANLSVVLWDERRPRCCVRSLPKSDTKHTIEGENPPCRKILLPASPPMSPSSWTVTAAGPNSA